MCIDEPPFTFQSSFTDNSTTTPTVIDKYVYEDEITDLDYKDKYKAAIIVFIIFLIILLAATAFLVY
jgi:hypothetical protein